MKTTTTTALYPMENIEVEKYLEFYGTLTDSDTLVYDKSNMRNMLLREPSAFEVIVTERVLTCPTSILSAVMAELNIVEGSDVAGVVERNIPLFKRDCYKVDMSEMRKQLAFTATNNNKYTLECSLKPMYDIAERISDTEISITRHYARKCIIGGSVYSLPSLVNEEHSVTTVFKVA